MEEGVARGLGGGDYCSEFTQTGFTGFIGVILQQGEDEGEGKLRRHK